MKNRNYLIHVTGPTCSGKTALGITLGKFFKSEIISYDSRQFYENMTIGTSVPTKKELKKCKHHFIQHKKITDNYNIGEYRKDALKLLKILFKKNNFVILVGGSGLYADSLIYGLAYFYSRGYRNILLIGVQGFKEVKKKL